MKKCEGVKLVARINSVKEFTIASSEQDLWFIVHARGRKSIKRLCKKLKINDSIIQLIKVVNGKSRIISKEFL